MFWAYGKGYPEAKLLSCKSKQDRYKNQPMSDSLQVPDGSIKGKFKIYSLTDYSMYVEQQKRHRRLCSEEGQGMCLPGSMGLGIQPQLILMATTSSIWT